MDCKTFFRKNADRLIPVFCLLAWFVPAAWAFDFYHDLNDDVLIRDILSGVYTGVPESRNAQMLFPLSWLLAGLYRLLPGVPVLGIFLWLCQAGSLYLIVYRSLRYAAGLPGKLLLAGTETLLAAGMLLYHTVFVQYTVTSGLLMTAAIFYIASAEPVSRADTLPQAAARLMPAALPALLAFLLRSEMSLLFLPLAAAAGIMKWADERPVFTKRSWCAYAGTFLLVLAGMLVFLLADRAAYGGEWAQFRRLFDARTQVYDFNSGDLRRYEGNEAFYDEQGISPLQCTLLENYNYGADDSMDVSVMESVAEYGKQKEGYFVHSLAEGLWLYRARLRNDTSVGMDELPWLLTEAVLAGLLLLTALYRKRWSICWKLLLLGGVRSVLWMYLILRERVPERISHPLYFAEIALLAALLLQELERERERKAFRIRPVAAALLLMIGLCSLPGTVRDTADAFRQREETNALDLAAEEYYRAHPDTLYLADVQSTVAFSRKLFTPNEGFGNYDLLGGWICKSPLTEKKMEAFGYSSMGEAVKDIERVRFVSDEQADLSWLTELFLREGISARPVREETISLGQGELYIWRWEKTTEE